MYYTAVFGYLRISPDMTSWAPGPTQSFVSTPEVYLLNFTMYPRPVRPEAFPSETLTPSINKEFWNAFPGLGGPFSKKVLRPSIR